LFSKPHSKDSLLSLFGSALYVCLPRIEIIQKIVDTKAALLRIKKKIKDSFIV